MRRAGRCLEVVYPMVAACCCTLATCPRLVYPHPDEPGREEDVDVPRPVKQRVWCLALNKTAVASVEVRLFDVIWCIAN